jgi:tRNA(Ile)-lysidine synthase
MRNPESQQYLPDSGLRRNDGSARGAKQRGSPLMARVVANLQAIVHAGDRLVIGLSGGLDSVVLLDILARCAIRSRLNLSAVHVNHQLSPNAARWARFCRALCRTRGIPLRVVKVTLARGNSVEAAARAARHEIFGKLRADYVVLAHNQDDQVETLLLQLLRGAGVKGLAAMPLLKDQRILRPLLDVPRNEIERYARRRKLAWVEDESNRDTYFPRNFLRHEVLPAIATRYPAYRATLARSARHFAEAAQLLDQLAVLDAGADLKNGMLALAALRRLETVRAKNLLRYFLSTHGLTMPPAERLGEALRQVLTAKQDSRVLIELNGAQLRRFAGSLCVVRNVESLPARFTKRWRGEKTLALPELGGVLKLAHGKDGISLARLRGRSVTIGVRRGGERLQPDCRRPRRSLKNLFQEARIPMWLRNRVPLIFCDSELVWAAGVGVDCAYRAADDELSMVPEWIIE